MALPVAEAEAGILSTEAQLRMCIARHWVSLHSLPKEHPFWKCKHLAMDAGTFHSLFCLIQDLLSCIDISEMETIKAFPRVPWEDSPVSVKHKASQEERNGCRQGNIQQDLLQEVPIYVSGAENNGFLATGGVMIIEGTEV